MDTNVITLYANPIEKEKYVHVFRDDKEKLGAVAFRVGNYLFWADASTANLDPLYIQTPHAAELLNNLDAIHSKIQQKIGQAQQQIGDVRDLLAQFSGKEANKEKVSRIIRQAPELMALLYDGELPGLSELQRLARLGKEGRLVNAETSAKLPCLDAESLAQETKSWFLRLSLFNPKRKKHLLMTDAQVMAWLIDANAELRENTTDPPHRVHLLTGDDSMMRAYDAHRDTIKNPTLRREHLLRHPRQFIPFVLPESQKGNRSVLDNLIHLLDRLFNPFKLLFPELDSYYDALSIVQRAPGDFPSQLIRLLELWDKQQRETLVKEITTQWAEILKAAAPVYQPREVFPVAEAEIAQQVAELLMREDVDRLLRQRVEDVYSHIQGAYSSLGFLGLVMNDKEDTGFSGILRKFLKGRKKGDTSIGGRVAIELRFEGSSRKHFENYHAQVRKALRRDPVTFLRNFWDKMSPYMLNLTHAMISAEVSEWELCREYCRQAYEDANLKQGEQPHEAAYFLAVAIRHSCRSQEDAEEALRWLEKARSYWEQAHPGESDWRLETERLALSTMIINHNAFCGTPEERWFLPEAATLVQVWNGFWDLLKQQSIKSIPQRIKDSVFVAAWERRFYRQVVVNLSSIYLHLRHVENGGITVTPEESDELYKLFTHYYPEIEKDDESYFTRFIKIACDWEHAPNKKKIDFVKRLTEHLAKIGKERTKLLSYEQAKFTFYLDSIQKKTKALGEIGTRESEK